MLFLASRLHSEKDRNGGLWVPAFHMQPMTGTKFGVIVETAASSVSKTRVTRSRNIGTLVLALIAGCYDYLVCVWVPEKGRRKMVQGRSVESALLDIIVRMIF